jgi:outer membrane murein-binding lipoprotein Lpp
MFEPLKQGKLYILVTAILLAVFILSGCENNKEKEQLEQQRIEQKKQAQAEELRKECEIIARDKADEEYNKITEATANVNCDNTNKVGGMSDCEFNKRNADYNKKMGKEALSDEEFNKARVNNEYQNFLDDCLKEKGL